MARPGERGYGKKPDDDRDGRGPKTLACHDPSRHTTKFYNNNIPSNSIALKSSGTRATKQNHIHTGFIINLKGHCIEFKYYADGIHSGLTPPG